mmetsp:Transcript_162004/g.514757  ORF Transcript_162004/g.514757 Transcript_162004/m.514757 type:complete len:237 (+) Transcript_162004:395-1105(+)
MRHHEEDLASRVLVVVDTNNRLVGDARHLAGHVENVSFVPIHIQENLRALARRGRERVCQICQLLGATPPILPRHLPNVLVQKHEDGIGEVSPSVGHGHRDPELVVLKVQVVVLRVFHAPHVQDIRWLPTHVPDNCLVTAEREAGRQVWRDLLLVDLGGKPNNVSMGVCKLHLRRLFLLGQHLAEHAVIQECIRERVDPECGSFLRHQSRGNLQVGLHPPSVNGLGICQHPREPIP